MVLLSTALSSDDFSIVDNLSVDDDLSIDALAPKEVEITVDLLGDLLLVVVAAETKREAANFFLADDIANAFCLADTRGGVVGVGVGVDEEILLVMVVVDGLTGDACGVVVVVAIGRDAFVDDVCNTVLFFVTEVSLLDCCLLSDTI